MADDEIMNRSLVAQAIESQNSGLLRRAIWQVRDDLDFDRTVVDESIDIIVEILGAFASGRQFGLSLLDVLFLIEDAVKVFSPPQRSVIIRSLHEMSASANDVETLFAVARLLGFEFGDREAFDALIELVKKGSPIQRKYALCGLEAFLAPSADSSHRAMALELCRNLTQDGDEDVRNFAREILEAAT